MLKFVSKSINVVKNNIYPRNQYKFLYRNYSVKNTVSSEFVSESETGTLVKSLENGIHTYNPTEENDSWSSPRSLRKIHNLYTLKSPHSLRDTPPRPSRQLYRSNSSATSTPTNFYKPFLKKYRTDPAEAKLMALYHGKAIKVVERYSFSHNQKKRHWKPNVQNKTYFSHVLQRNIRLPVSIAAMDQISKYGGFDEYIQFCPVSASRSHAHAILKLYFEEIKADPKMDLQVYLKPPRNVANEIKKHVLKRNSRFYESIYLNRNIRYQDNSLVFGGDKLHDWKNVLETLGEEVQPGLTLDDYDARLGSNKGQYRNTPTRFIQKRYTRNLNKMLKATQKPGNSVDSQKQKDMYADGRKVFNSKKVKLNRKIVPEVYY